MFRGNALDQEFGSTEAGLAAMTLHLFRWPVVGEMFVLTTPFIEPPRPLLQRMLRAILFMSRPPLLARRGILLIDIFRQFNAVVSFELQRGAATICP
jgi:hypothetical protein